MPQLNVQDFAPQLIWLAITFISLYFIMAKVAIPKIAGAIEQRHSKIADDIDAAQSLKNQTEKAIAAYEAALADARSKAHSIAQENRDKLTAEIEAEQARADARIAERLKSAEAHIAATRDKAMAEVRGVAKDIAGEVVTQLTGSKASAAEINAALTKAQGN